MKNRIALSVVSFTALLCFGGKERVCIHSPIFVVVVKVETHGIGLSLLRSCAFEKKISLSLFILSSSSC